MSPAEYEQAYWSTKLETAFFIQPPSEFDNLWLCGWQEQWFKVELVSGWSFRARLRYDPSFGFLDLKLYHPDHNGLSDFIVATPEHVDNAALVYNNAEGGYYHLRVHGRGEDQHFNLIIETQTDHFGHGNDLCETVLPIERGIVLSGSTEEMHDESHASCGASLGPDAVYLFDLMNAGSFSVILNPEFDGILSIRTTCTDPSTEVRCMDQSGNRQNERIDLTDQPMGPYYIWVDGVTWEDQGDFTLRVD